MRKTVRQAAAEPVLRRIVRDQRQASEPVAAVLRDIGENFLDAHFDVESLAADRGDDWPYTHSLFAVELDLEPEDYLAEARLETALRLLQTTRLDPTSAGRLAGFPSPRHFNRASNRYLGLSPSRLRELVRRPPAAAGGEALPPPLPPADRARLSRRLADQIWELLQTLPFPGQQEYLRHELMLGEPHLFELLSRRSLRDGRRDPRRGLELAELALATVEGSAPLLDQRAAALKVLALTRLGGARRRDGDRDGAGEILRQAAEAWQRPGGPSDPRVAAELWLQQGRLALAEGRHDEGHRLLDRCLAIARVLGVDVEQTGLPGDGLAGGGRRDRPDPDCEKSLRQPLHRLERQLVRRSSPEI